MGNILLSLYDISVVAYIVMYIAYMVNHVGRDFKSIAEQGLYRSFVVDVIMAFVPVINLILAYQLYKANRKG